MTTTQSPVRIEKAIEAAQAMADALYALNKAGQPFSVESETTPFGQTKKALLVTLQGIYGNHVGRKVYEAHVETGDSIRLVVENMGIAPIAR